jgi:polyisoprenyl-teichoic acid--peptidoglycan teichoic acid transferase
MSDRVRSEYGGSRSPARPSTRRGRPMSFVLAAAVTIFGTILPGAGLIAAGLRWIGGVVLVIFTAGAVAGAYLGATHQREIMHWAVQPEALTVIGTVLPLVGIAWVAVIVGTYRAVQPRNSSVLQRLLGSGLVAVLALSVLLPMVVGGRYATVQKRLVEHVFASEESKSATRPKNATRHDPWAGQRRVNILLLGGDGGEGRDGIRPDSQLVASIDTHTGDTILFSLPRNLEKVPFPPDSVLADAYPDGIYDGEGDRLEWMLNSIYRNVPQQHPDLLDSDNPGADANKLAVGATLGVRIDYYVLLNLQGFSKLIDALGGIRVNVNTDVAIGGSMDEGIPPKRWIEEGPDQLLNGYRAMWFARGRYGTDDYQRMERQRCTMQAIIDQANPGKVLTRYEAIAKSSKDLVFTDIPSSLLPAFVDLSTKVKGATVTSIAFTNKIIHVADPDYELIQSMVSRALRAADDGKSKGSGTSTKAPSSDPGDPDPTEEPEQTAEPVPASDESPSPTTTPAEGDSLEDACAYTGDDDG